MKCSERSGIVSLSQEMDSLIGLCVFREAIARVRYNPSASQRSEVIISQCRGEAAFHKRGSFMLDTQLNNKHERRSRMICCR